jgi:hypothetical protein
VEHPRWRQRSEFASDTSATAPGEPQTVGAPGDKRAPGRPPLSPAIKARHAEEKAAARLATRRNGAEKASKKHFSKRERMEVLEKNPKKLYPIQAILDRQETQVSGGELWVSTKSDPYLLQM